MSIKVIPFNVILFDDFETLDAFGPVEFIGKMPHIYQLGYFSLEGGMVLSSQKLSVNTLPFSKMDSSGIVLIPGGMGTRKLVLDTDFIERIKSISQQALYVLTVCTGSALLAKTGLLDGRKATSNKRAFEWVKSNGHDVDWASKVRWVNDGKYYTSSGISAGMDMILGFISDVHGEQEAHDLCISIEYIRNSDKSYDPFGTYYREHTLPFGNKTILSIQCSNTQDEQYALFCDDKGLYHGSDKDGFVLLGVMENIRLLDRPVKMYYHYPYVCVTERYGLHAAVVNVENLSVIKLEREDYHCDVSSYSIGFFERDGQVLLIHQTQWNRLDITNPATGELLTERKSLYRNSGETEKNQQETFLNQGISLKMEKEKTIDFFHSLLHISPDGKHFLSNGWIWQPSDNIMCFETERFLKEYETCGDNIRYYRGYSWDRPCTFIGNEMFAIAADYDTVTAEEGADETGLIEPPAYHQLLFYKLSEVKAHNYTYSGYEGNDTLSLAYSGKADCDVFSFDEYGDIAGGELYYDPKTEYLIALSQKGAFVLDLNGKILHNDPEIKLYTANWNFPYKDDRDDKQMEWLKNWQYDAVRCSFYRFHEGKIERRRILPSDGFGVTDQ